VNLSDFVLRYRLGEGEWQIFTLSSKETLIGRGEDNDLILDHREVSRHHLRLSFIDNLFQITDLESSNGTQLDGISLSPQFLLLCVPGR
jgi:pSer/pThr/pTyr-binding forkhead associated (FHA) protein